MSRLKTVCKPIEIQANAPNISSDGGILLLKEVDKRHRLTERMAACLVDSRRGEVKHTLVKLLRQRAYAIAMGWEDCNDFDALCQDPLYQFVLGSRPASQSTLSRFENWADSKSVYRMSVEMVDIFVERQKIRHPKRIVIDIDATVDPTHGQQQYQLFNGFYDCHCYLPLLIFGSCDGRPMEILSAVLRPGNAPSGKRAAAILRRVARRLRDAYPKTKILVRADAGFSSPEFYKTCEDLGLEYLVAMQGNAVLDREAEPTMVLARAERDKTKEAARLYTEFSYAAGSWDKKRRVIVKAEALPGKAAEVLPGGKTSKATPGKDNCRFVVTNLSKDPQALYGIYCLRGESENRIKELKLDLASGRTSCHTFIANAFRLMLHALAFCLSSMIRDHLDGTCLFKCTVGQIRLKFLKMAAIIEESTRRILIRLPRGHPHVFLLIKVTSA